MVSKSEKGFLQGAVHRKELRMTDLTGGLEPYEGWYFKQQGSQDAFTVIAVIQNRNAHIQINTRDRSYSLFYGGDYAVKNKNGICSLRIGNNFFENDSVIIDVMEENLTISADLKFTRLHPLHRAMAGSVTYLPIHHKTSTYSICHRVTGQAAIHDDEAGNYWEQEFSDHYGYLEYEKGSHAPSRFFWTQCLFMRGSLKSIVMTVDSWKMKGHEFFACGCVLYYSGKEVHIASHLGAKVVCAEEDYVCIRQGNYILEAYLDETDTAPELSVMGKGQIYNQIQKQSLSKVKYCLSEGNREVFHVTGSFAGWESKWNN